LFAAVVEGDGGVIGIDGRGQPNRFGEGVAGVAVDG
jgi:hypothetical protein